MLAALLFPALAQPSVDEVQWKHRLVVLVAHDPDAAEVRASRDALTARSAEAAERKLKLVTVLDQQVTGLSDSAPALTTRWTLTPGVRFEALLVGLDGGVKARVYDTLDLDAWFARIDAMPMRLEELRAKTSSD